MSKEPQLKNNMLKKAYVTIANTFFIVFEKKHS